MQLCRAYEYTSGQILNLMLMLSGALGQERSEISPKKESTTISSRVIQCGECVPINLHKLVTYIA